MRSVRELAHRLNLTTVAEGVEDATIEKLMVDIGFDLLQGYHFVKPMREAALLELMGSSVTGAAESGPIDQKLAGLAS